MSFIYSLTLLISNYKYFMDINIILINVKLLIIWHFYKKKETVIFAIKTD